MLVAKEGPKHRFEGRFRNFWKGITIVAHTVCRIPCAKIDFRTVFEALCVKLQLLSLLLMSAARVGSSRTEFEVKEEQDSDDYDDGEEERKKTKKWRKWRRNVTPFWLS